MNIRAFGSLVLLVAIIGSAIMLGAPLAIFFDLISAVLVGGIILCCTLWSFTPEAVITALRDSFREQIDDKERAINNYTVLSKMADFSVAAGIIGTIMGLVMMLQNMDDPTAIGPAMAVALLTMFYGTLLGELVFRSMANTCLNKQNIFLERPSRRGFSSVYLTMVSLFMLLTTFMVMLVAML